MSISGKEKSEIYERGQQWAKEEEGASGVHLRPIGQMPFDLDGGNKERRAAFQAGEDNYNDNAESSRVICTHFYQRGLLRREVWRADMAFTQTHISGVTIRGYHYWGIPYVKLMRRSTLAERIMFPLVKWRAEELAYQMGVLSCSNFKGKLVRIFGESLCWLLGCLVSQKDWRVLSEGQKVA